MVRLMYLEVSRKDEKFGLSFYRLNHKKKVTTKTFNSYKLTSKLYLCIWRLNCGKIGAPDAFRS